MTQRLCASGAAGLCVGRLASRRVEATWLAPGASHGSGEYLRSPLTVGAFGLWVGYTLC